MKLKELLLLNNICFGVDNPKIYAYFGTLQMSDIDLSNYYNKFIYTGKPNCLLHVVFLDNTDRHFPFNYYFNVGDLLSNVDPSLIKEFEVQENTVPVIADSDNYQVSTVDLVYNDLKCEGTLTSSQKVLEFYSSEASFTRYYLIVYDNVKSMKL